MTHTTVSIGYRRVDGDFAVLATLNNNDDHIEPIRFDELVKELQLTIANNTGMRIEVLERQDTPDYVCTDPECWGTS